MRDRIIELIQSYGYVVKWKILNSRDHGGVPQNRPRFYLIGIKQESMHKKFRFPRAVEAVRLSDLLLKHDLPSKMRSSKFGAICRAKALKHSRRVDENICAGLSKLQLRPTTANPCVIDVHASARFTHAMANVSPALTATRAGQDGHYICKQKRFMHLWEMARLQGFGWTEEELLSICESFGCRPAAAGRRFKHGLGNAITCTVLMRLLPRALFCAGLLKDKIATPTADDLRAHLLQLSQ